MDTVSFLVIPVRKRKLFFPQKFLCSDGNTPRHFHLIINLSERNDAFTTAHQFVRGRSQNRSQSQFISWFNFIAVCAREWVQARKISLKQKALRLNTPRRSLAK
jgi:hypothetical protein